MFAAAAFSAFLGQVTAAAAALTDNFNRANTTSGLGTTSDGTKTWRDGTAVGTWGITSNMMYNPGATAGVNHVLVDPGVSRATGFTVKLDLVHQGVASAVGIFFACTDENNGYVCEFNDTTGHGHLYKVVSGTYTSILALSSIPVAGDTMVVVVAGNTITLKKISGGVTTTCGTITDSSVNGTMCGPYENGNNADRSTFDNLIVTSP